MTTSLREALDDLVTEVPAHVIPVGLARTAWAAGRRRRARRWVAGAGLAAVLVAGIAVVLPPLVGDLRPIQPAGSSDGSGVQGYPQRIGHQWWVRDLPDRPGPVAGLMKRVVEHETWDEADGWYVLSGTGHRWRLRMGGRGDDAYPTISPDGQRLGYLVSDLGPYVIHDLMTGQRTEFAEVGSALDRAGTTYMTQGQSPSFWSADGTRLLLWGGRRNTTAEYAGAVVLGIDGSLQEVHSVAGTPAGFSGNDLVWVSWTSGEDGAPIKAAAATVTSPDGTVQRTVQLLPAAPWETGFLGQWTGVVSPDGTELLIVEDPTMDNTVVHRFSLADGSQLTDPVRVDNLAAPCGAGWAGTTPTVPIHDEPWRNASTAMLDGGPIQPILVVEPGEGTRCFIWASDALTGRAHGGLFGMATGWWSWWWREIVAVALGAGVLWAIVYWRRRRMGP